MTEEAALESLFRAPLEQFVAVRKQLATQLKAAGDNAAAGRLQKLKRPTVSVWVVNQLWWHERAAFDELFAQARRMSAGDLSGAAEHRRALNELREAARRVLKEAGHAANEATLRRITTTLAALAAAGGFDPDRPGALEHDRDPPGFEALALPLAAPDAGARAAARTDEADHAQVAAAEAAERKAAERKAAERAAAKAAAEQAARLAAERRRIEAELVEAKRVCERRRALVAKLKAELEHAERELGSSQDAATRLEQDLAALRER